MTVHGRVDCLINPADPSLGNREQELWANCVQFLTGALAQSLGIQLVASNYGTAGKGLGFWDDQVKGAGGTNKTAWAVFRWNSAPRGAFEALLYIASGSGTTLSPFNISGGTGVFVQPNSFGMFGMAFACHPSGTTTHPFNGTTGALGTDTFATQIWQTGSIAGSGAFFPRANSIGGAFQSNRNFLNVMHPDAPTIPMRQNILISEGTFTMFLDVGLNNAYEMFHFGGYSPRPGFTPAPDSPYVQIFGRGSSTGNDVITLYNSLTYGTTAGNSFGGPTADGGIANPSLLSSSKTAALVTLVNNELDASMGSFNQYINGGSYDQLPLFACIVEGSFLGILGQLDVLSAGWGMNPSAVNLTSGTLAIGRNLTNSIKILVPWSGSSPGNVSARTGREF
jgi:hypothetical protein